MWALRFARLGWWLGNPRHDRAWTRSGPFFALAHLFLELFGKTRGRNRYVYLSDGEHFENLGIYELVRRRCRLRKWASSSGNPSVFGSSARRCAAKTSWA